MWAFLAVTVPLAVTPGASTAVVLRNSLSGGVRSGLVTTVGVNAGSLLYGVLCAFGAALALQRWPSVWIGLRVVGGLYLAWLGLQSLRRAWRQPPSPASSGVPGAHDPLPVRPSTLQDLRQGFLTNAMNPSLATYYFAVVPQFIPAGASIARTALLLTAIHISIAASCHTAWAIAGGTLSRTLSSGWPRRVLDALAGAALLVLAASFLF